VPKRSDPSGTPAPAASALLSRIGRLDFVGRGLALSVLARLPSMQPAVDDAVRYAAETQNSIAADRPAARTPEPVPQPPDPGIAELRNEFPGWDITSGMLDMVYAEHRETGERVHGEDTTDLRDAILAVVHRAEWTA
jgi:hypothetical protein